MATQLSKENSSPAGPPEISAAVARLTSNSIDELHKLVSELQKMQEFLKSEVDNVQRQIDSAVAGINIIVETSVLGAGDVDGRGIEMDLLPAKIDELAHLQHMPEGHQLVDLGFRQKGWLLIHRSP